MNSKKQSLELESSPNSTEKTVAILPVDSWANLEAIKEAVGKLQRWVSAESEGGQLLKTIEENVDYLIQESAKEGEAALEWAANL